MGIFDFFAQYDMSNPEAQIINSPMFNTALNQPAPAQNKKPPEAPEAPTPINYGKPGSSMAGSLMHKLGMKKTPEPLTGPLVGGKTYGSGKSKEQQMQESASKYVPKGYKGLAKSGQVWGNVGNDPKTQAALPALTQTDANGVPR